MEEGASARGHPDSGHQSIELVSSRPRNIVYSHVTYSNPDNVSYSSGFHVMHFILPSSTVTL